MDLIFFFFLFALSYIRYKWHNQQLILKVSGWQGKKTYTICKIQYILSFTVYVDIYCNSFIYKDRAAEIINEEREAS